MSSVKALFCSAPPAALVTLLRIVDNILAAPDEQKFRTLKRSNRVVSASVLSCSAGEAMLARLGFRGDSVLTTSADIATLTPVRAIIAAALGDANATVSRVCAGGGWVIHGLVLEMKDGTRAGAFLENSGDRMTLTDDAGFSQRGGVWHSLHSDERVVAVSGRLSTMGYLCGSITLGLSSGREIGFVGENASVTVATRTTAYEVLTNTPYRLAHTVS